MSSFIWKGRGKNQKKTPQYPKENSSSDLKWLSSDENDEHDDVPLIPTYSSPSPTDKRRSSRKYARNVIPHQEPVSPLSWMASPSSTPLSSSRTLSSSSPIPPSKDVPSTPTTVTSSSNGSSTGSSFRTPNSRRYADRSLPGRANGAPPKHSYLLRRTDLQETKQRQRSVKDSISHVLDYYTAGTSDDNTTDDDSSSATGPVLNINVNLFSNAYAASSSSSLDTDLSGDNTNDQQQFQGQGQPQSQVPKQKKNLLPSLIKSPSRNKSTSEVDKKRRKEGAVKSPTKHRSDSSPSISASSSDRKSSSPPRRGDPVPPPTPPRSPAENSRNSVTEGALRGVLMAAAAAQHDSYSVTSGLRPPSLTGNPDDTHEEYESVYFEAPLNDERNQRRATIQVSITTTKPKRKKSKSRSRSHSRSSHGRRRDHDNNEGGYADDVGLEARPDPPPFLSSTERTSRSFDYFLDAKIEQHKKPDGIKRSSSSGAATRRRHKTDGSKRQSDEGVDLNQPPPVPADIMFAPKTTEATAKTFAQFLPSSKATDGLEHGSMEFLGASYASAHSARTCPITAVDLPEDMMSPSPETPPATTKERRRPSFLSRYGRRSSKDHLEAAVALNDDDDDDDDDDLTAASKDSDRSRSRSPGLFRRSFTKKSPGKNKLIEAPLASNKDSKFTAAQPSSTRSLSSSLILERVDRTIQSLSPDRVEGDKTASSIAKPRAPMRSLSAPMSKVYKAPFFPKDKSGDSVGKRSLRKSFSLSSPHAKKATKALSSINDKQLQPVTTTTSQAPKELSTLDAETTPKEQGAASEARIDALEAHQTDSSKGSSSYLAAVNNDVPAKVKAAASNKKEVVESPRRKDRKAKSEKRSPRKHRSAPGTAAKPRSSRSVNASTMTSVTNAEQPKENREKKDRDSSKRHSTPRRNRSAPESAKKLPSSKKLTATNGTVKRIDMCGMVAKADTTTVKEDNPTAITTIARTSTSKSTDPRRIQSMPIVSSKKTVSADATTTTTTTSASTTEDYLKHKKLEEEERARKERRARRRERRRLRNALALEGITSEHTTRTISTASPTSDLFDSSIRSYSTVGSMVSAAVTLSPGVLSNNKNNGRTMTTGSPSPTTRSRRTTRTLTSAYKHHRPVGNWTTIRGDPCGLTPIKKSKVMS